MGRQWKQCQTLFFWAPKSLQLVTAAMKLKDAYSWKESYDQPRQHIEKQRHYFINKGPSSQGCGFSRWEGEKNPALGICIFGVPLLGSEGPPVLRPGGEDSVIELQG